MDIITTLSSKFQIVIPKAIRKQMGLKPGDKVYMEAIDQNRAILMKEPADYLDALDGLGKDVWKKLGGTKKYLRKERAAWNK